MLERQKGALSIEDADGIAGRVRGKKSTLNDVVSECRVEAGADVPEYRGEQQVRGQPSRCRKGWTQKTALVSQSL